MSIDDPTSLPATTEQTALSDIGNVKSSATSQLWLVPPVIIVAAMWGLYIIPGKIWPLTMIHFMTMQSAPILGAIGLFIWWFASRKLPVRQRVFGAILAILTFVLAVAGSHSSMKMLMYAFGLPVALSLLVGGLVVTKPLGWPKQGWLGYGCLAAFLVGLLFFRVGKMDAAFSFSLVPRSTPSPEETFLAEIEKADSTVANTAEPVVGFPSLDAPTVWADFRGINRDNVVTGVTISTDWTASPPQELWRRSIGPGWSSFCVVGPWAITQEQRGNDEAVVAYDVEDGSIVWTHQYLGRFEASMGGVGPRATPTYRDGRLYVTGASGVVFCLDASSGDRLWEFDLVEKLGAKVPEWGFASSPLVFDDKVIVSAGGGIDKGVACLNKDDGSLAWSATDGTHTYCSPQLSTLHGKRQILVSDDIGVSALDPKSGELLWEHDWVVTPMPRVTQPMVVGNSVYLGTGYGHGTRKIDVSLDGEIWSATKKWTARLKPYFNDAVYHDGHIYGFDGPIMMCIDAETGKKRWKRGRYGHGQVLMLRDQSLLLVVTEEGELVLAKADPKKLEEVARMSAIEGVTWNHPVIVGNRLFVRNSQEMACFKL